MRKVIFANNEIYHIFNRGVERKSIFTDNREYNRAITTFNYYHFLKPTLSLSRVLNFNLEKKQNFLQQLTQTNKKLVEIICYCLMPNHFHLLIKQMQENGISRFMNNFANSYTRYYDTRHDRIGPLFEGIFRAIRIETNDQLLYVDRYIHINPTTSFIIKEKDLDMYPWSSLPEYLNLSKEEICDKDIILDQFPDRESYRKFVHDQVDYAQKLKKITHLILENTAGVNVNNLPG